MNNVKRLNHNILSYSNWNGFGCYAMFHFIREFYPGEDFDMMSRYEEDEEEYDMSPGREEPGMPPGREEPGMPPGREDDDTPKQRARKISKMLDVHQGLIAQDVLEVFPTAIQHSQNVRKLNFELSDQTIEVLNSVGITDSEEIEAVKQHYIEKGKGFEFDMYSLNWSVINTYQILALQDFKKMYDAKCEEIEELKSELATIKAHLGLS